MHRASVSGGPRRPSPGSDRRAATRSGPGDGVSNGTPIDLIAPAAGRLSRTLRAVAGDGDSHSFSVDPGRVLASCGVFRAAKILASLAFCCSTEVASEYRGMRVGSALYARYSLYSK